jgi:hypothetical protein
MLILVASSPLDGGHESTSPWPHASSNPRSSIVTESRTGPRSTAAPIRRSATRTLAERLISELSGTEFHPENYEDEYRKRVLKAIEQKVAGQEIERVEVEDRPPTTDLVARLKASLGRRGLAKAAPTTADQKAEPAKQPARRRRVHCSSS